MTVMTALFRWWKSPSGADSRVTAVAVSANLTPEATTLYPGASTHDDLRMDK